MKLMWYGFIGMDICVHKMIHMEVQSIHILYALFQSRMSESVFGMALGFSICRYSLF